MKINKPDLKQHIQFDKPRSGCGLGCFSIGCMGVIGAIVMIGIVGYYGMFHSSLPLKLIEAAIEKGGEVEIEGLTGNLSNGFSADELRFKSMDDRWSNLKDIKFKYEGDTSLFGADSLIIKEVSVGSGTIYAEWDPEENEIDLDPDFREEIEEEIQEMDDEFQEFEDEMREEIGRSPGLRELRIDLVSVANLKIVNPETELEITIDEMKFEGFEWNEDDLQSLGKLLVHSSQLELETVPSIEFAEMKNAERFEGILRAEADHRLKVDVPFAFDFGVSDKLDVSLKSELFDGQVQVVDMREEATLNFVDFSPADFIDLKTGGVLPSNVNMKLQFGENKDKGPIQVNQNGSLELGKTRFRDLRIQTSQSGPSFVKAVGNVNGETVLASFKIAGPYSPWWKVSLESEAFDTLEELWAQTLFGNEFAKLSDEQQATVRASIPDAKADPQKDVELPPVAKQGSVADQVEAKVEK